MNSLCMTGHDGSMYNDNQCGYTNESVSFRKWSFWWNNGMSRNAAF